MILSPAKLNLSLKIDKILDDGYHSISSHVFFLDLFDRIHIRKSSFNNVEVEGDFKNDLTNNGGDTIISKSLSFCQNHFHTNQKINVKLQKNIPVSAGLGGGSANSASIIRYFLSQIKFKQKKLINKIIKLSATMGSDVPACLYSSPLLMEGKGEKIKLLKFNDKLDIGIVLMNPKIQLSTKKVFKNLVIKKPREKKQIINVNNFSDISKISSLGNDLEKTAIKIVPEISNILDVFKKYDACFCYGMSGSGATCYGIFYSRKKANDFKRAIIKANETKNYWIWSGGLLKKRDLILKV